MEALDCDYADQFLEDIFPLEDWNDYEIRIGAMSRPARSYNMACPEV